MRFNRRENHFLTKLGLRGSVSRESILGAVYAERWYDAFNVWPHALATCGKKTRKFPEAYHPFDCINLAVIEVLSRMGIRAAGLVDIP